jgi:Protein of unknown function (DUF1616)
MHRRNPDLLLVVLLAATAAVVVNVVDGVPVRIVFALPLLLILPGYALTAAIFARRRPGMSHVVLLSVGLSLAVAALGALLLDLTVGLRTWSWSVLELCVVCGGCAVALVRRRGTTDLPRVLRIRQPGVRDVLLLLGAALLAAAAVAFARTPLSANKVQGYTALWLVPTSNHDYSTLRLGVKSGELRTQVYRLVVTRGGRVVYAKRGLVLEPAQAWTRTVAISPPRRRGATAVTARLYRSQDAAASPYRTVRVWLRGST